MMHVLYNIQEKDRCQYTRADMALLLPSGW